MGNATNTCMVDTFSGDQLHPAYIPQPWGPITAYSFWTRNTCYSLCWVLLCCFEGYCFCILLLSNWCVVSATYVNELEQMSARPPHTTHRTPHKISTSLCHCAICIFGTVYISAAIAALTYYIQTICIQKLKDWGKGSMHKWTQTDCVRT